MKPILKYSFLAALLATSANAQTAYTDPVGYVTVPLPGTAGASTSRLQIASQQLLPSASTAYSGVAESISSTTLTDNEGTWSAGNFVNATPPTGFPNFSHLIEILDGPLAGTMTWISGSAANTLTTYDDLSAAGSNVSYRIIKAFTIASLLTPTGGAPAATVLGGGGNASSADNLLIFNSETNTYTTFYYKSSGVVGGTGWRSAASNSVDVGSVAIHPNDSGLVFVRKQSASGSIVIAGDVKTKPTDVLIRGGGGTGPSATTLNIVQANIPVDQITLGTSGLYTGNSTTGLLGGGNPASADNVLVFDAATNTYTTYYYKSSGVVGGTGWRSSASNSIDQSATVLPSTSAILIQRKSSGTDFIWQIPQVNIAP